MSTRGIPLKSGGKDIHFTTILFYYSESSSRFNGSERIRNNYYKEDKYPLWMELNF